MYVNEKEDVHMSMRKRSAHFCESRERLRNDTTPGQASTAPATEPIDKVNKLVRSDRHLAMQMLTVMVVDDVGKLSKLCISCAMGSLRALSY